MHIQLINKVKLLNVCKEFQTPSQDVKVLDGIDLEIQAGDKVVIVGPSGCGKSTLFSLIGAIDLPTRGEIWFNDLKISDTSPQDRINLRKRNFGFIFQNFALIKYLTVKENLDHTLQIGGIKGIEKRHFRISSVLEEVNLLNRTDYFPSELSGGEKQKIAFARAVLTNPSIILADEPSGRLDFENATDLWEIMLNKVKEQILIVFTHDFRYDFLDAEISLFFLNYGKLKALF